MAADSSLRPPAPPSPETRESTSPPAMQAPK